MKNYLFILIFISINACSTESLNNSISVFEQYILEYKDGTLEESKYFNQWITIPPNQKLLMNQKYSKNFIKDIVNLEYSEVDLIAVIQNLRFKILKYDKESEEKRVLYQAKIVKCYKGNCSNKINYFITKEVNDSFYPDGSQSEIVFLKKINKKYYADPFLMFVDTKKTRDSLEETINILIK